MSTWGSGLFSSDSAQDFLEEMRESTAGARLVKVREILESVSSDPSLIMREYAPEEVLVAAAMIGSTLSTGLHPDWIRDRVLQEAIADIGPQVNLAPVARSALQAAADFNDGWLISSLKDESDRQAFRRELDELSQILEARL